MLAVKIKRLKISKSYSPNYNFVQFPWPAIPSTVHSSQIIVHLIMNPLKSTGTCVHVLIVSLPGFSVGNTAGENPGYSSLEIVKLEVTWFRMQIFRVRYIRCIYSYKKNCDKIQPRLITAHENISNNTSSKTFAYCCCLPSFVRVVSPDWD